MYFDLIIVGGGPAGLTAAIYAARYKLNVLVIAKDFGHASTAHKICNYPGYIEIGGMELIQKLTEQVLNLGVSIKYEEVKNIVSKNNEFLVNTDSEEFFCKKILFCAGTNRKKLNVPGEEKFIGKGVSYCATCDAAFFKNKRVAVLGGSNSALTAALLLSEYASEVLIIYRRDKFYKAEPSWIELVNNEPKIKKIFNEEVIEICGNKNIEFVKLKSKEKLEIDGLFIEIGSEPNLNLLSNLEINTEKGYIIVDENQETNLPGFYSAGDITNCKLKQIITAASQGAIAAFNVYEQLKKEKIKK